MRKVNGQGINEVAVEESVIQKRNSSFYDSVHRIYYVRIGSIEDSETKVMKVVRKPNVDLIKIYPTNEDNVLFHPPLVRFRCITNFNDDNNDNQNFNLLIISSLQNNRLQVDSSYEEAKDNPN